MRQLRSRRRFISTSSGHAYSHRQKIDARIRYARGRPKKPRPIVLWNIPGLSAWMETTGWDNPGNKTSATLQEWWMWREVLKENQPCTVRQFFYRLSARHLIPKTGVGYDRVVAVTGDMRYDRFVPVNWFYDAGRSARGIWDDPEDLSPLSLVLNASIAPSASLWSERDYRVVLLVEKEGLINLFMRTAYPYAVLIVPTKGFASISLANDMAQFIDSLPTIKTVIFGSFGDYDGAGLSIPEKFITTVRHFTKRSITMEHIRVCMNACDRSAFPDAVREPKENDQEDTRFSDGCLEIEAMTNDQIAARITEFLDRYITSTDIETCRAKEAIVKQEITDFKQALERHGWDTVCQLLDIPGDYSRSLDF